MPLRFSGPPASTPGNEDLYEEFPSEPEDRADAPKNQDWLAEFPDEKSGSPAVQSKNKNWFSGGASDQTERSQPRPKERN